MALWPHLGQISARMSDRDRDAIRHASHAHTEAKGSHRSSNPTTSMEPVLRSAVLQVSVRSGAATNSCITVSRLRSGSMSVEQGTPLRIRWLQDTASIFPTGDLVGGNMACCQFGGHRVKVFLLKPESMNATKEVPPRVQVQNHCEKTLRLNLASFRGGYPVPFTRPFDRIASPSALHGQRQDVCLLRLCGLFRRLGWSGRA